MILLFTKCQRCRFFRRNTGIRDYECVTCFYDRYEAKKREENEWSEEHPPAARGILELVFILGLVLWATKILLFP